MSIHITQYIQTFVSLKYSIPKFLAVTLFALLPGLGHALNIDVALSNTPVARSGYVYARIVVSNTDAAPREGVVVSMPIPDGTQIAEANSLPPVDAEACTFGDCNAGETASWSLGTMPSGFSKVIVIPFQVLSNATIDTALNFAPRVSYTGSSSPASASRDALVQSIPAAQVSITAQTQVVGANEKIHYEVAYGNKGTSSFTGTGLKVAIPAGTTVSEISDGGVVAEGEASWNLANVAGGTSGKRFLTLNVPAGTANGTLQSATATISSEGSTLAYANETVVIRSGVNLTLDATVTGDNSYSSNFMYYRYVVANKGDVDLADVKLHLSTAVNTTFPEANTFPSVITSCSFGDCEAGEWGTYTIGELKAGESRVLTVPLSRTGTLADGQLLINHALVTEGSGAYTLGTKPTVLYEATPGLNLVVSADKQVLAPEEAFVLELAFNNLGSTAAQNLKLNLQLPPNTTFVSATDGGTHANGWVNWDLKTLNAGVSNKRFVTLKAPAGLSNGHVLVTKAQLHTDGPSLARAGESLVIRSGVNLTLDATVTGDNSYSSNFMYYRYVVANKGDVDLADVKLHLSTAVNTTFPEANTFPSVITSCSFGDCEAGEWGTYTIGELKAGESRVLTVPLSRTGTLADGQLLINHALVTEGSGAYTLGTKPTVLFENSVSPQLVISSNQSLIKADTQQTFAITVGNPRTTALDNALVVVTVPVGYTYVSSTGGGEYRNGKVYWPFGTMPTASWSSESLVLKADKGLPNATVLRLNAALIEAENNGDEIAVAYAGIFSVVENKPTMTLNQATTFDSPLAAGSLLTISLTADNRSGQELADVTLSHMVSLHTAAGSAAIDGATGCSFSSCDPGEWGGWALGNLADTTAMSKTITPRVATTTPGNGYLLISSSMLVHTSVPRHDQVLVNAYGLGAKRGLPENHDSDGDGIPDWWEVRWGYDRWNPADATTDDDNDGSNNLEEYREGTDPTNPDTDGDGILDGPDKPAGQGVAPNADAGPNQPPTNGPKIYPGDTVTLSAASSSDDQDALENLTFNWTQKTGDPATVTLANANAVSPTFTAPDLGTNGGCLTFVVTVTDTDKQADTAEMMVCVTGRTPPVAAGGPDGNVSVGEDYTLDGSNSSDADGEIAAYLWEQTGGVAVILSDATAAKPSFTAPAAASTLTFKLTVTDNHGLKDTDEVAVNVAPYPVPVCRAGPDQSVPEYTTAWTLSTVSLDGSSSTINGGTIASYLWKQKDGTTVTLATPNTTKASFTVPAVDLNGETLTFELTCTSDKGVLATDSVLVTVGDVNRNPKANAGPDQIVAEGTLVTLDASASSDEDGDTLTYQWEVKGSLSVTLSSTTAAKPTFTAPNIGVEGVSITFELRVSDGTKQATDTVVVNITDVNAPPVALIKAQADVAARTSVTLDGSDSSDPDSSALKFSWTQKSGKPVTLVGSNTAKLSFVTPDVVPAGEELEFELSVSDGALTGTTSSKLKVTHVATPPTVNVEPLPLVSITATNGSSPGSDRPMLGFAISAGGPGLSLSTLTLSTAGTLNESTEVESVILYRDSNQDGRLEANEKLATSKFTADNGALTFTLPTTIDVDAEPVRFYVTYEL